MLNHSDAAARLAVLELLTGLRVSIAAPKVLAIAEDDGFHDRALRERQVALKFLFENAFDEAEHLAAELTRKHGLFGDRRVDPTRVLAVQLLGAYGRSADAADAVKSARARVWWNPKELRAAAEAAAAAIAARQGG